MMHDQQPMQMPTPGLELAPPPTAHSERQEHARSPCHTLQTLAPACPTPQHGAHHDMWDLELAQHLAHHLDKRRGLVAPAEEHSQSAWFKDAALNADQPPTSPLTVLLPPALAHVTTIACTCTPNCNHPSPAIESPCRASPQHQRLLRQLACPVAAALAHPAAWQVNVRQACTDLYHTPIHWSCSGTCRACTAPLVPQRAPGMSHSPRQHGQAAADGRQGAQAQPKRHLLREQTGKIAHMGCSQSKQGRLHIWGAVGVLLSLA